MAGVQYFTICCFIKHPGLADCMGTQISQQYPRELKANTAAFMAMVHPIVRQVSGLDHQYVSVTLFYSFSKGSKL